MPKLFCKTTVIEVMKMSMTTSWNSLLEPQRNGLELMMLVCISGCFSWGSIFMFEVYKTSLHPLQPYMGLLIADRPPISEGWNIRSIYYQTACLYHSWSMLVKLRQFLSPLPITCHLWTCSLFEHPIGSSNNFFNVQGVRNQWDTPAPMGIDAMEISVDCVCWRRVMGGMYGIFIPACTIKINQM